MDLNNQDPNFVIGCVLTCKECARHISPKFNEVNREKQHCHLSRLVFPTGRSGYETGS